MSLLKCSERRRTRSDQLQDLLNVKESRPPPNQKPDCYSSSEAKVKKWLNPRTDDFKEGSSVMPEDPDMDSGLNHHHLLQPPDLLSSTSDTSLDSDVSMKSDMSNGRLINFPVKCLWESQRPLSTNSQGRRINCEESRPSPKKKPDFDSSLEAKKKKKKVKKVKEMMVRRSRTDPVPRISKTDPLTRKETR